MSGDLDDDSLSNRLICDLAPQYRIRIVQHCLSDPSGRQQRRQILRNTAGRLVGCRLILKRDQVTGIATDEWRDTDHSNDRLPCDP